ncbi:beta-1,3-galactosyltransferase 1-like [Centruroides sculpturatus]|uniref:beta-1,3-galactosyltransferase 1-like n=1 Tax=Centruroides sculpturatus TaxID=218467 RepID=UPI000C6CA5E1|nr:beta-1,3-galactosyltransferase 1-like [Centruroides sculpturatus]XP_023241870.1 beta-1,3-galactosyltransferase 1-like [Centruroides sculpturatus]XP_023241871.1 beta-1,3-galactosyltransferase 1-like [Centruroides sculpturatus]
MPRICLLTLATILFINLLAGFIYLRTSRIIPYTTLNITTETEPAKELATEMVEKQLSESHIHPHPYKFILNNDNLCSNDSFTLLILVCSSVKNYEQRKTIRETWGSLATNTFNKNEDFRMAFLIGAAENDTSSKLLEESKRHNDIIQEDFIDSYNNLTLKSVMLLKWVKNYCPNVRYILKTDDDMYINVQNLIASLKRLGTRSRILFGVLFRKAKPDRNPNSKWYVPKAQFSGTVFPDYLSGTAYAMTRDSVDPLFNSSLETSFMVMEDVYITGLCAQSAGVKRLGIKGFTHGKRAVSGCSFLNSITGHHVSVKDMRKIWTDLQKPGLKCK